MKKYLSWTFLAFIIINFINCGGNGNKDAEISRLQAEIDSLKSKQNESKEIKQTVPSNTINEEFSNSDEPQNQIKEEFTTTNGTYEVDEAIQKFYEIGIDLGAKEETHRKYNGGKMVFGTEENFKKLFLDCYGIPNNDKAKQIYNKCYNSYIKGHTEGMNF